MSRLSLFALTWCPWWAVTPLLADTFPPPNDTQPLVVALPTPQESLSMMALPDGFTATVFAGEPAVNNPIACCWDERGRLWVAENFTYGDGKERYNLQLRDRIVIFEDTDHDGVHDRRTVFTDQVQMLTSIERGLGGVWIMAPPHLLFVPDADGDDVPDGPSQVILEGFSTEAASRHTFANGLKWGPDGWLYGRGGISSTSYIGVPGSKSEDRLGTAGGLWRYHPTRKVFDIVCAGTTNPWGSDWNEEGELFFINTVIGHLWHGIHGAHFKRMHGQDLNPCVYEQMDQIADHYHWDTGGRWQDSRPGDLGAATSADALGGGHAHVGMMIYQGVNWPAPYRGKVFTANLHGRRVNVERLEREGSGYVGRHEPDILKSNDVWFRGVEITYGPDGGVYVLDWSDIGECHENDGVHRNSGRIFKIRHGAASAPEEAPVSALSDVALVRAHTSQNEWFVRMARWELRERRHRGQDMSLVESAISQVAAEHPEARIQRQLLWTRVYVGLESAVPSVLKAMANPALCEAALSLLGDALLLGEKTGAGLTALPKVARDLLVDWAGENGTPSLRLKLASFAIKYPAEALFLLERLLKHDADASDTNLPLMYWYAVMDFPTDKMVPLFAECRIPLVRKFMARRCTEEIDNAPEPLNQLLALGRHQNEVLAGMSEALDGWAKAPQPIEWKTFTSSLSDQSTREKAQSLEVLFGDGRALSDIKKIALDRRADLPRRENALRSLVTARADGLRELCEQLLTTHGLSVTAMRGLALFDDAEAGQHIARHYGSFYPHEQQMVIDTLTTRPVFAQALLDHIAAGSIPKSALGVIHARQIRALKNEGLDARLSDVWGEIRESSVDKQALIEQLKNKLTPEWLTQADMSEGRALFNQACASCHKLYGAGNLIGPDLTGSGRHDINYLIENIVDPSALLAADYRMTIVTMKDGRVFSGNVAAQNERTLTLKMVGVEETLERSQIVETQQLPMSLMPEGLLQPLDERQVRDLIAYLMGNEQVELK